MNMCDMTHSLDFQNSSHIFEDEHCNVCDWVCVVVSVCVGVGFSCGYGCWSARLYLISCVCILKSRGVVCCRVLQSVLQCVHVHY